MSESKQLLKLEIPSRLSDTPLIAMAVRGVCSMTSLPPVALNHLELCLVEVVNNAIEHAYEYNPDQRVEVCLEITPSHVQLIINDWGLSIPEEMLQNQPMPSEDTDNPESWLSRGRGLHIVRKLMDQITYTSSKTQNSFSMRKAIS